MATFTANYNLRKPAGGDLVTVATDINASMDIIDAELKDHEDRTTVLEDAKDFVIKSVDQSRTSSTAFQHDDELFYNFPAIGTYVIEWDLLVSGDPAADIDIELSWTATLTLNGFAQGLTEGSTNLSDFSRVQTAQNESVSPWSSTPFGVHNSPTTAPLKIRMTAVVTALGNIRFRWTQGVSNATATVVKAGSTMKVEKVA